ncbi:MAG: chitobiase/beta-hexosaminidase C-terminal domain-containing protein [Verrucomicrobia bacterium]|nr:chitobiase/beta-hexosaminidase C-terminal domain-containing protein [Verrucomicrobiota bacterium]
MNRFALPRTPKRCRALTGSSSLRRSIGSLLLRFAAAAFLALDASAQTTVDFLVTNRFVEPHSVAVDANNKFYITDSADHRVFKYDPDNGTVSSIAGVSGQSGTTNGPGFIARFFSPRGLALARGGLVVADSGNHLLRFLSLTGSVSVVTNFAGSAGQPGLVDGPIGAARFNSPIGLAADAAGNIYVADSKNNAVRKIDTSNVVSTLSANFLEPAALAIGSAGELYVADTRNHSIKLIKADGAVSLLAGRNSPTGSGINDSFFADEASFASPGGLIWLGGATGLLVSDSGNHTLRRVYFDPVIAAFFPEKNGYSVETYAGTPRQPGLQDGPLNIATFNSPAGLARDFDNGLLIADLGNAALRRIQTTPKLPKVASPKIGQVTFIVDKDTGTVVSKLSPFSDAIFNNDVIIAILAEERTETFFTSGSTPGLFDADTIPVPNSSNSQPAPPYKDGVPPSQVKPTLLDPRPDVTVKALSTAEGRRPSDVVQARIQFKVATPVIIGDNPASFVLTNDTSGADLWYTLDGTDPTNAAPSGQALGSDLSLKITNAVTFRARGFKRNYKASEITTKTFFPNDFQANRISFGFERGEASSQFLGSAGQTFIAPVTLSILPSQKIYQLQFNLTVTNLSGAASLTSGAFSFKSMLTEPVFEASQGVTFDRVILPRMFDHFDLEIFTNSTPQGTIVTTNFIPVYRDALVTNVTQSLLGVGWFEVVGRTNLYDTRAHDLVSFSIAHDKRFSSADGRAVLGGYSFVIPGAAASGSNYRIQVGRPSGTDALSRDVFIDAPKDGPLGGGGLNATKDVKVVTGGIGSGELHYIVGDIAPFRWFNAGDFGDTNILNNDVYQVFQSATYAFNVPPAGTDFFDAMDSCCNNATGLVTTNVFDGSVTAIDDITHGDGTLNVTDVFVTFRRALDPSLKWYARFWVNGQRQAAAIQNQFRGSLNNKNRPSIQPLANLPADTLRASTGQKPSVIFQADDLRVEPGQIVHVPIRAEIAGDYPMRVLMFNVTIEPLDGSPPLTEPIVFTPVPQLGQPIITTSRGRANYAAAWLDHSVPGVRGAGEIGSLRFTVPQQSPLNAAYRVHFDHVSASPNGISVLPVRIVDGVLTASDRSASSFQDGIPDSWRLRYFGSTLNSLSRADFDADGDGLSNLLEFAVGTNPNNANSQFRVRAGKLMDSSLALSSEVTLRWPSVKGRTYLIEAASGFSPGAWLPIASNLIGTGHDMEFTVSPQGASSQFYRVRIGPP